jgi:hypothetical protein
MMTSAGIARKDLRILQKINFEEEHADAQRRAMLGASLTFGRLFP